jgi:tRNA (uracil-5-)-methyltransferase
VSLAYQRFSSLPSTAVPAILPTIGSPEQWAYRTKITPHFDAIPKRLREAAPQSEEAAINEERPWEIRIGFDQKGRRGVLDIEECPIATDVLNAKMTTERKRVQE